MRRLLVLASVAALASGWLLMAPSPAPPVAAGETAIGRTTGKITCFRYQYETRSGAKRLAPAMPCDLGWSEPVVDPRTWEFEDDDRFSGRAGNGLSYTQTIGQAADFDVELDADGNLVQLVLNAGLETTVSHAGDTKVALELDIPFFTASSVLRLTDSIDVQVGGGGNFRALGDVSVRVDCGGADEASAGNRVQAIRQRDGPSRRTGTPTLGDTFEAGDGSCLLHVDATVEAHNSEIIKSDHRANASAQVAVTVDVPPCDLGGLVRDGIPGYDANPRTMSGIPVELLDTSLNPVHRTVSDRHGKFCFRDVVAADYGIRATLEDGAHDPPIFRTTRSPSDDDVVTETTVAEADFGRQDYDVKFEATDAAPWLPDAAAIHREATRYVDWLLGYGVATVDEMGSFTIRTAAPKTNHLDGVIGINVDDTRFADRSGPATECPENCEWHEIAHHLERRLGFAVEGGACNDPVSHGGWRNPGTCDSMSEGFARFLSLWGSLTIDETRGAGYATPDYADLGNDEHNGHVPWQLREGRDEDGTRKLFAYEDDTVSELLWDLVDDTPGERSLRIAYAGDEMLTPAMGDTIHLDGVAFLRRMADTDPQTVVDLYVSIADSDLLPLAQKQKSIDLDGDGTKDISELDAVFLLHEFHPVPNLTDPWYRLGDAVGPTDREPVNPDTGQPIVPGSQTVTREHIEPKAGSAILLENPLAEPTTFTIEVTYPETTSRWEVVVPPGGSELFHLELPPASRSWVDPTAPLPPCAADGSSSEVALTISAPGVTDLATDSCAYELAVAAATGDAALTFDAVAGARASAGPGTSAAPGAASGTPTAVPVEAQVAIVGLVAVLVGIGAALFVRRRQHV